MFANNPALPTPPTDQEKYSYTQPNSLGLGFSTLALLLAFGGGSWLFIQSKAIAYWLYLAFASVVCVGLLWNVYIYIFAKTLDVPWLEYRKRTFLADTGYCPSVDVYLPSAGEPLDLLDSNFYAVSKMSYPRFRVWVLDDSDRAEVKQLAKRYGFEYICRSNRGEHKKAGNMRYAFPLTKGDLIAVFDADFCPRADFLDETAWLFGHDEKLGVLQTPHYFQVKKSQPAIERGASQLQEIFFRVTQVSRDKHQSAICCGSNALYRREALEQNGGSALVPRSEDVATGLVAIQSGYTVRYLPLVLAAGLSPDTLRAFVNQLYRWAAGCFQTRLSKYLWHPAVPLRTKLIYCSSALYFAITGIGVVGFTVPGVVNLLLFPANVAIANYLFIIPAVISVYAIRARWSSLKWDSSIFYAGFIAGYICLIALFDFLRGDLAGWVPTGAKRKKGSQYGRFILAMRWIPAIGLGLCLMGLFKNWALISPYAWVPTTTFWLLKFWASRLVLAQDANERSADHIWMVMNEFEREKAIQEYYANHAPIPAPNNH